MLNLIKKKLRTVWRKTVLMIRGRIRHHDRFGLTYWLWTNTRAMGRQKLEPGTDDTGVLEQLKRLYPAMDQAKRPVISIDVGAYIGVISLSMSHFGPSRHFIHSFEADEINYSRLTQNISFSPKANIATYNKAVANYIGSSKFTRYKDPGNNHLGGEPNAVDILESIHKVLVITLDAFVDAAEIDIVDILKIDVEEFDLYVLQGAKKMLKEKRINVIIVETPSTADKRKTMNEFLIKYGFSTAYIVRNSKELTNVSESMFNRSNKTPLNMLAIRSELVDELNTKTQSFDAFIRGRL